MQAEGSVSDSKQLRTYNKLTLTAQKLEFCDARISESRARESITMPSITEGNIWIANRDVQLKKYTETEFPKIIERLNTYSIFFQGTGFYLDHLYSKQYDLRSITQIGSYRLRSLAQLGKRLTLTFTIAGLCCLAPYIVVLIYNYDASRDLMKPITWMPYGLAVPILAAICFMGAYILNLSFILRMRCVAGEVIQKDSIQVSDIRDSDDNRDLRSSDSAVEFRNQDGSSYSNFSRDYQYDDFIALKIQYSQ